MTTFQDSDKANLPAININNPINPEEETYYGKFRMIVKQRFFGLKLEEEPFMEFIEQDQDMKQRLGDFVDLMARIKNDYINFLKKTYPDKIEKRKKKRKGKKKDSATLDVPKMDSDCYSSDYSGVLSTSRDDITLAETGNEVQALRNKIENIKKDFCFDSIENVAKNIHLFDDVFGKLKAEHTQKQQFDQLRQLQMGLGGLMNLGIGSTSGGVSFAFMGGPGNNQPKENELDVPKCFDYFTELYNRYDEACEETGYFAGGDDEGEGDYQ